MVRTDPNGIANICFRPPTSNLRHLRMSRWLSGLRTSLFAPGGAAGRRRSRGVWFPYMGDAACAPAGATMRVPHQRRPAARNALPWGGGGGGGGVSGLLAGLNTAYHASRVAAKTVPQKQDMGCAGNHCGAEGKRGEPDLGRPRRPPPKIGLHGKAAFRRRCACAKDMGSHARGGCRFDRRFKGMEQRCASRTQHGENKAFCLPCSPAHDARAMHSCCSWPL